MAKGREEFEADMHKVAIDLINSDFGATGKLLQKSAEVLNLDTFEMESTEKEKTIEYYLQAFESRELIENKIKEGDAKLFTFVEPDDKDIFIDEYAEKWEIVNNQITPIYKKTAFITHVRKLI